ncbi:hypothetical protein QL285_095955 [Trifolium repens]|nr:hypothetical protein QL285_095955 [Trifolium repens]
MHRGHVKFRISITHRDVNLQSLMGIPAEISSFGVLKMEIFHPWGRGWREKFSRRDCLVRSSRKGDFSSVGTGMEGKFPRGDFGVGIGEEAFVPADSPNPSIA